MAEVPRIPESVPNRDYVQNIRGIRALRQLEWGEISKLTGNDLSTAIVATGLPEPLPIADVSRQLVGYRKEDSLGLLHKIHQDREVTRGLNVTERQLAEFVDYMKIVAKHQRQLHDQGMDFQAVEFNGQLFNLVRPAPGPITPPMDPFTREGINQDLAVTSLENGAVVTFSERDERNISSYGFYGKVNPAELAQMAGYAPADTDDPVYKQVHNPFEQVPITTVDQFRRAVNLYATGLPVGLPNPDQLQVNIDFSSRNEYLTASSTAFNGVQARYISQEIKKKLQGKLPTLQEILKKIPSGQVARPGRVANIDTSARQDTVRQNPIEGLVSERLADPSATLSEGNALLLQAKGIDPDVFQFAIRTQQVSPRSPTLEADLKNNRLKRGYLESLVPSQLSEEARATMLAIIKHETSSPFRSIGDGIKELIASLGQPSTPGQENSQVAISPERIATEYAVKLLPKFEPLLRSNLVTVEPIEALGSAPVRILFRKPILGEFSERVEVGGKQYRLVGAEKDQFLIDGNFDVYSFDNGQIGQKLDNLAVRVSYSDK